MKCGKCELARIDLEDDEDIYYCPFDNKYAFHSGEECHHPHERYRESVAKMVEPQESEETETWNGIHAQITAPKGTFDRIFNDADDDNHI